MQIMKLLSEKPDSVLMALFIFFAQALASPVMAESWESKEFVSAMTEKIERAKRQRTIGLVLRVCGNKGHSDEAGRRVLFALAEYHFQNAVKLTMGFKDRVSKGALEEISSKATRHLLGKGHLLHVVALQDIAALYSGRPGEKKRLKAFQVELEEFLWVFEYAPDLPILSMRARILGGKVAVEMGRYDVAVRAFDHAIETVCWNAKDNKKWRELRWVARYHKTCALFKSGRYGEVLKLTEETLSIYPELPDFYKKKLLTMSKEASKKAKR